MTRDELLARVGAAYAELDPPSWPDPHLVPGTGERRDSYDEEYERVTDAARYRVVHERARAWSRVLTDLGAAVEALGPAGTRTGGARLTSPRAGTLPLLLQEYEVPWESTTIATLEICVADEAVVVERHPDCACDACDHGSDDLLEAVDEAVLAVVVGPYAALRHPDWEADWHPEGGSSGHSGKGIEHETLMGWCRLLTRGGEVSLPPGTTAYVGSGWFEG